jgi:mRNA-degrading endonuclease YafQ of YafQ-DinJ toxin-antitoxin module
LLPCVPKIETISRNKKFESDFKKLPLDVQVAAKDAIRGLKKVPIPKSLRLHSLHGYKNPKVFTIDVMSNHAYKISLEIDGTHVILRRVGTHKILDSAP